MTVKLRKKSITLAAVTLTTLATNNLVDAQSPCWKQEYGPDQKTDCTLVTGWGKLNILLLFLLLFFVQ